MINATAPEDDPGYELVTDEELAREAARLGFWVRSVLVILALGFLTIFGIALWLNPYRADGERRTMATHMQLGLPSCSTVELMGVPCPSCGMTTSFSLLAHGDLVGSLKANWVGTIMAIYWFALIPWAAIGAWRDRYLWIRSGETLLTISVIGALVLMLIRWAWIILL